MKRHYIDVHKVDENNKFLSIYLSNLRMYFVEESV